MNIKRVLLFAVPAAILIAIGAYIIVLNRGSVSGHEHRSIEPKTLAESFMVRYSKQGKPRNILTATLNKRRRFGFGHAREVLPPRCSLPIAMIWYNYYRPSLKDSYTEYYDKDIGTPETFQLDTTTVAFPKGGNGMDYRSYVERILASNGVTVVNITADQTVLLLTKNLPKVCPECRHATMATATPHQR